MDERDLQILNEYNNTDMAYDDTQTIVSLFARAVAEHPRNTAVAYQEKSYTYEELDSLSDAIAVAAQELGLGRGDVVSVLIPRGEAEAYASLGALKAGCAYQPLDDTYPEERLNFMVSDSGAKLLITTEELSPKISEFEGPRLMLSEVRSGGVKPAPVDVEPDDLFILLYTSGSTGTPKGVRLTHRNLVCFVDWYWRYYGLQSDDVVGQYASYGFDACMMDMYPALTRGATLVIIPEDIRLNLNALNAYMEEHHITHQFMTTQVGRQYAMEASEPYLRHLSVGGEKLAACTPPSGFAFHNLYGPTECTILTTAYCMTEHEDDIPIGKPLDNVHLYVVDDRGQLVAPGETGELWVAGPHVADGYLNRPEKTAEVFLDNPFDDDPKYRHVYRTGDFVRWREDGNLMFGGRMDGQVKIRGFRIELSEVEAVVREYPGVRDATVAAFDSPSGGKYICAYVVGDEPIDTDALNAFIADQKPPYMVPAATMQLDAIPLTQNHKVDRRSLPQPSFGGEEDEDRENTKLEDTLLAMASKALGFELHSVSTDLVEAGLTSISSISLVTAIENDLGVELASKDILAGCSVLELENLVVQALIDRAGQVAEPTERELLSRYPITQTQFGIYSECLLHPESTMYNIPYSYRMEPKVDAHAVADAVAAAIDAHGAVKCSIAADADGTVYLYPHEDRPAKVKVRRGSEDEAQTYWKHFVRPFDLAEGPLYRACVYATPQSTYLFVDFHHVMFDGGSLNVFLDAMDAALKGQEPSAESYTVFDLAADEAKALAAGAQDKAKGHYDNMLRGCAGCAVPDGDLNEALETCGELVQDRADLSRDAVRAFCESVGVTENAFFLAAMGFVLWRYTAADDVAFTTVYNGRTEAKVQNLVGMLVKTLPVRCFPEDGMAVTSYVRDVSRQLMGSMANDAFSFAQVSRTYNLTADFMLVYQGDFFSREELGGHAVQTRVGESNRAMSNVSMDVLVVDGSYRFDTQYRANRYSEAYIARLGDALACAAQSMLQVATLGEVDLCSPAQREVMAAFNDTAYPVQMRAVHELMEAQAAAHPDREAVVAAGERITYAELNARSNRIAHALVAAGLGSQQMVGLVLPRTTAVAACEYGVWKAGGAFLPMVPEYPDDRIDFCLRDADCPYVITTADLVAERPELFGADTPYRTLTVEDLLQADAPEAEQNLGLEVSPADLAYCIYTSGSTGRPKGVMIEHGNLCNFVDANERNLETRLFATCGSRVLGLASISFDVSMMETHITLANGQTLVMAGEEEIHNPLAFGEMVSQEKVEVIASTPSFLSNVLEFPEVRAAMAGVRMYDVGAEAFPGPLYAKIMAASPEAVIVNGYGPTEATVSCVAKTLSSGEHVTIGKPAANVHAYVMDKAGHLMPTDASGELVIAGAGVGRGYVKLPDKTAAAFFEFEGERAYRTGDLVRYNADGEIEFFGRLDNQVKLRGLRVELDEIENVMNTYPGVKVSKVIVRNNGTEDYLAGFFTAELPVDVADLTAHLAGKLTYYMVPSVLMQLDEMPLTVNGKIDKNALPDVEFEAEQRAYVAPVTDLERDLCDAYADILGLDRVSVTDSFFEIGGTSLSATRLVMHAMNEDLEIAYKDVFDHPSPRELAAFVSGEEAPAGASVADKGAASYDYAPIDRLLAANRMEHLDEVEAQPLGDIILTGATGFLGIHVLADFLANYDGRVWCLMRKGSYESCERRLNYLLMYYFDRPGEKLMGERIFCVEGDITEPSTLKQLADLPATTVINCAAIVKHFTADDLLDRVNVGGVRNLVDLCVKSGKRLIQVSTTSVAEDGPAELEGALLHEDQLYLGQSMDNDYVRTKFLAERVVLEARATRGLDGTVIRVGNLMSRMSDGEFQINSVTNSFMRSLKAYRVLGLFPVSGLDEPQEFSPIDSTAASILKLAQNTSDACVYHAYNNHTIAMADVIAAMRAYGFDIKIVADETFSAALSQAAQDPAMSEVVLGIVAYDEGDANAKVIIGQDNRFTTNVLYRLGYKWPITDDDYLTGAIRALDTLGFFE